MNLFAIKTVKYSIIWSFQKKCSMVVCNATYFKTSSEFDQGFDILNVILSIWRHHCLFLTWFYFKENYIVHAPRQCENIVGTNLWIVFFGRNQWRSNYLLSYTYLKFNDCSKAYSIMIIIEYWARVCFYRNEKKLFRKNTSEMFVSSSMISTQWSISNSVRALGLNQIRTTSLQCHSTKPHQLKKSCKHSYYYYLYSSGFPFLSYFFYLSKHKVVFHSHAKKWDNRR